MNAAYSGDVEQLLAIDVRTVESVWPSEQGVVIRYLNGERDTVNAPYHAVLEWLDTPSRMSA